MAPVLKILGVPRLSPGGTGTGKNLACRADFLARVNGVFITDNSLSLFSRSCVVIMRRKLILAILCYFNRSRISSVGIAQAGGHSLNSQAGPILRVLK